MALTRVQITMVGHLELDVEDQISDYTDLEEFLEQPVEESSLEQLANAMIQYDLDTDLSLVIDEVSWDSDKTVITVQ